ncbi:prephenate dehydrogenase [Usitatibacter palustris]|uniref:prephenate dehydrogenase n=1 Tax=Usitatibacter palustris TaxID=2732487 RepID=A0A6M4H7G9_9PROT|nr:prephenate dehydrogenase/arogenate dehydrogenase family protein [Usitatibacter palustris]QJR15546.1 Cyclohexadienyl dehydrogenase [Usitatibacter palustris]
MRRLKTVAVVGVGLIGGSFALALRRAGGVATIVGADRDAAALERATALGVIDTAAESAADAARGADLVFISVPVRQIPTVLHDVALAIDPTAVITDAGSTKEEVVRRAREEMRDRFPRFVPGHPIAGRETSGVESATVELFRGARVVLTPCEETDADAVDLARTCWEAVGARVALTTARQHDEIFASVSHLPHLLAFALVSELGSRDNASELFSFAAGGFRDFTRIAGSSPEMWRDIALQNRDALLAELERYEGRLAVFRELIDKGDGPALERLMREARSARHAWLSGSKRSPSSE